MYVCVHCTGVTEDLLQLTINCSTTPHTWCRAQFSGDCFCISHNDTSVPPSNCSFPENTSFLKNSIFLLVNQSEFRKTFAGSFIACAVNTNIFKAYHIAGMYVCEMFYHKNCFYN